MNKQNLMQAINECNNGQLSFNLGNNRSFLFKKKWYPLRATINRAREINQESELTTDRALLELCITFDYVKIGEINFTNNLPVAINQNEILNEVKLIAGILNGLSE
jgi:hypothetical protein